MSKKEDQHITFLCLHLTDNRHVLMCSINQHENKTGLLFLLMFILYKHVMSESHTNLEEESNTMLHIHIQGQNYGCRGPGFKGYLGI